MKTKKLAAWFLSLAMALSLAACGGDSQTSGGETGDSTTADTSGGDAIVLRASHSCAISHPYQLGLEKFAELVDEKTNGAVQIDIFHSAQLGDERANIEDLQMGTLDIAVSSTGPLGNFVSDYLILDLPFLFTSYEHAHAVLDGEIGQNLMAKLDDIGIVVLGEWLPRNDQLQASYQLRRRLRRAEDPLHGESGPYGCFLRPGHGPHADGLVRGVHRTAAGRD